MLKTGLHGPYRLTFDNIEAAVTRTSAGVFVLGHADGLGRFCVRHVGRSDSDVRSRLRDFIGCEASFKYVYFASPREAFLKECELFHDFNPPANRVHPDRPRGTNWICPRCRLFAG